MPVAVLVASLGLRGDQYVDNLPLDSIYAGQEFSLEDPSYYEEDQQPNLFAANRTNEVRLIYGREDLTDWEGNDWGLTVVYTVYFTGVNALPLTDTLRIGHSLADLTDSADGRLNHWGSRSGDRCGTASSTNPPTT